MNIMMLDKYSAKIEYDPELDIFGHLFFWDHCYGQHLLLASCPTIHVCNG
ncbi:MAG: hypothetical protein KUG82_19540 [Pseudomonadales bacterium]|nr:hypothetical protein [Pseudomonadales bacterium]